MDKPAPCESNGCIEVEDHNGHFRIRSTVTGTVMQCTREELIAFRDRIKAGELDDLDNMEQATSFVMTQLSNN
jgi:hypothetical protein